MMILNKKNIRLLIFLVITSFCTIIIYNFKSVSFINVNKQITDFQLQLTYYYPNDATGSGTGTGSGKTVNDFTVDSNGWYHYEQDGIDYLVVAAATTYCRDSVSHCGVSINKHGMASSIPYYNYYDTFTITIGFTTYNAMVLDSCGACMWGDRDTVGEKIDIFVQNGNATKPNIYPSTKGDEVSSANNVGNLTSSNGVINFTTTYSGNINEGYIYRTQLGNALNVNENVSEEKLSNSIFNIIGNIFNNVAGYKTSTSIGNYDLILSEDVGDALSWKQSNKSWSSIKLGSKGETIGGVGCLATSVAIQIKISGTQVNSDNFNPGTWVNYLNGHGGFSGSLFNWSDASWTGLVPNWHFVAKVKLPSSKQNKIETIDNYLTDGYYPVICVKPDCGHWVAVTGVTDNDVKIADPGSKATTVSQKYDFKNVTTMGVFQKLD